MERRDERTRLNEAADASSVATVLKDFKPKVKGNLITLALGDDQLEAAAEKLFRFLTSKGLRRAKGVPGQLAWTPGGKWTRGIPAIVVDDVDGVLEIEVTTVDSAEESRSLRESVEGYPAGFVANAMDSETGWEPWEPPSEQPDALSEFRRLTGLARPASASLPMPVHTGNRAALEIPKGGFLDVDSGLSESSLPVEIAYRVPGKGSWKRKTFKTQEAAETFVDKLMAKEGSDVEVRWGA